MKLAETPRTTYDAFYSKKGVSLKTLIDIITNGVTLPNGKVVKVDQKWTTEQFVAAVVRTACTPLKAAFVDVLPAECVSEEDYACVFVSHAWAYNFADLVDDLAQTYPADDTHVWLDFCCVKQPPDLSGDSAWFSEGLHVLIASCRLGVCIRIDSWANPLPLTRIWCVWELFGVARAAGDSKKPLRIALGPRERSEFVKTLTNDFSRAS